MSNRCVNCKFYDSDWEWDGEDECRIDICLERHNEYLESSEDCPFFQRFRRKPYVEKNTKCDECKLLQECISTGNVVETTLDIDERRHFVIGLGVMCKEKYGVKGV